ncbi:MAG: RNA-protein complex protein Nop10 [Candidatus Hadarchaeales archaeon]
MKLRKCRACEVYTLKETCPKCGRETSSPHPPRFSPLDPYGKYRRMTKRIAG